MAKALGEKWVFKAGRTSGPTIGRQHGVTMVVRMWEEQQLRTETTEHVILSFGGQSGPDETFAKPGDSGALVYSANGHRLGLVWGGMDQSNPSGNEQGWQISVPHSESGVKLEGVCFYTPIDAIIESLLTDLEQVYGKNNFKLVWGNTEEALR